MTDYRTVNTEASAEVIAGSSGPMRLQDVNDNRLLWVSLALAWVTDKRLGEWRCGDGDEWKVRVAELMRNLRRLTGRRSLSGGDNG